MRAFGGVRVGYWWFLDSVSVHGVSALQSNSVNTHGIKKPPVPHTDTTKRSHLPSSARIVLWSPQRKHLSCKSSGWRWIFLPGGAALDEAVQDREQLTQHSDQSFYGFSSGS